MSGEGDSVTLRELGSRLWRRRWLIAGVTAAVVAATLLWTFLSTPRYRSTAVVRILESDAGAEMLGQLGGSVPGLDLASFAEDDLATEIGVLGSRRIHGAVVDSLGLRVRLVSPAGERSRLIRVLSPGPAESGAEVLLERREDGSYAVSVEDADRPLDAPTSVRPGEVLRLGPVAVELLVGATEDLPDRIELALVPRFRAVEGLRDEVRIQRAEGGARLVEVSYEHPDRHLAAAVVDGLVSEYLEYKATTEQGQTRSRAAELRDELERHAVLLQDAEEALREFQQQNRVLAPEEEATQQVRRLGELQVATDALRVERQAVADLLRLVEERAGGEGGAAAFRQLATLPSLISNGAIQNMLETLVELENERSTLLTLRQPDNVDVRQLEQRIGELETQLHRLASSYLESLDRQLASTTGELARLNEELEGMPALEMEYLRRLRERRILDETYVLLQTRLSQAEVQEAIHDVGVRVVDPPAVPHPDDPSFPRPAVHLLLGLLLGLTAGTGGALARDLWDTRVHTREDARTAAPGLEVVATLPRVAGADRLGRIPGFRRGDGARRPSIERDPWSPAAQAYRALATSLALSNGAEPPKVLSVTSPMDGEGKSTVACNLAVAVAQQGLRTVLVDADLREGSVHRAFEMEAGPGVVDVLEGRIQTAEALRSAGIEAAHGTLDVLTSGGPLRTPLDGRKAERFTEVLQNLRGRYDRVVLDLPSVEGGGEALALGRRSDAVVLVARRGRTDRDALGRAAERIRSAADESPLLVVNDAEGRSGPSR